MELTDILLLPLSIPVLLLIAWLYDVGYRRGEKAGKASCKAAKIMKLRLLVIIAALGAAWPANAERGVIEGKLVIINNQFVVKMDTTLTTLNEDDDTHVSSKKVQVVCSERQAAALRALIGKRIVADGEVFIAHTRYHIEPLLIDVTSGDYFERK